MSLSVIILCKNEAANLPDCIASVKPLADEIIVIDGESTDDSPQIARSLGAKVFLLDAWDGWGKRRQQAQELCSCEYVMHLDADERLSADGIQEIRHALSDGAENIILALPRITSLFGSDIHHCGWYPDYVLRIYKRSYTHYDDARVHEKLIVPDDAQVVYLKEPLRHFSYPYFQRYIEKQASYITAFGENNKRHKRSLSLFMIPVRGLFSFIRTYLFKGGFLDGKAGLWLSISTATYTVNKYLALYLKVNNKPLRQKDIEEKRK